LGFIYLTVAVEGPICPKADFGKSIKSLGDLKANGYWLCRLKETKKKNEKFFGGTFTLNYLNERCAGEIDLAGPSGFGFWRKCKVDARLNSSAVLLDGRFLAKEIEEELASDCAEYLGKYRHSRRWR
jgi:hypothetical protein